MASRTEDWPVGCTIHRWAVLVMRCVLPLALAPCTAPAAATASSSDATGAQASREAASAIGQGPAGVRDALRSGGPAVAQEILRRASVTETMSTSGTASNASAAGTVCRGAVTHRETIAIVGVHLAWRQVRLAGWGGGGGGALGGGGGA